MKLYVSSENQEERLGKVGNLRGIIYINDHDNPTLPIEFRKIDGFRLELIENSTKFLPGTAIHDGII